MDGVVSNDPRRWVVLAMQPDKTLGERAGDEVGNELEPDRNERAAVRFVHTFAIEGDHVREVSLAKPPRVYVQQEPVETLSRGAPFSAAGHQAFTVAMIRRSSPSRTSARSRSSSA